MNCTTLELKRKIWEIIDDKRDDLIKLCSEVIKIPSDNPPGDTTQLANFLREYMEKRGIEVKTYEPKDGNPNLVVTIEGSEGRPHLILNAHMDQFPAEVGEPWGVDPYSGELKDGSILGRGACDMKGGLTSLLFSFCLIKEMGLELPGKLTLTLVSDEETGGVWGAKWLLDNVPDLLGDACLNTEPSGLTVRIGEKGVFQILLKAIGKADHGSYAGYAGDNAIMKMVKVLPSIERLREVEGRFTEETEEMIKKAMESIKSQLSHMENPRIAEVLKYVTVNVGVLRGGTKVNIVPGTCEAEVDMRLPLGINQKEMKDKIKEILNKVDEDFTIEYLWDPATMIPAYYTSQNESIFKILQKNATQVTGDEPDVSFSSWASDCRFFGAKNIPTIVYGPKAYNMAAVDEYITVEDLLTVTKVHAGTIIEFLNDKINL